MPCRTAMEPMEDISEETMFCAGNTTYDSCVGDSGGPIFTQGGIQVGLTSFGDDCAKEGKPGVSDCCMDLCGYRMSLSVYMHLLTHSYSTLVYSLQVYSRISYAYAWIYETVCVDNGETGGLCG